MRNALTISCLAASIPITASTTTLLCPLATQTSVSYHTIAVELVLGNNSTCTGDAEVAFTEALNRDLELKIGASSNAAPFSIQANLCPIAQNSSQRALSSRSISLYWYGKAKCSICSAPRSTRGRRQLDEIKTAQEAAEMLSLSQTQMLRAMFGTNPGSCLYQDSEVQVTFNITETFYKSPPDPCEFE